MEYSGKPSVYRPSRDVLTNYWWRRRESNPRPQMLPLRIYMLSSRLEVSRQVCRRNKADLVLFCENLAI